MSRYVAIYIRTSTGHQHLQNQEQALRQVAERAGWNVVRVYADHAVSGTRRREARPAFQQMCRDAVRREFDTVAAWSVDRLGRSLSDLVTFLGDLETWGVNLFLLSQGVDTASPTGRALFAMLGIFAEFERSIIQERVRSGLHRARLQGKVLGRPKLPQEKTDAVVQALASGRLSLRAVARTCRVGVSSVQRIKDRLASSHTNSPEISAVGGRLLQGRPS